MTDQLFSDEAIQQYLSDRDVVVLSMLTATGAPLATPMWFVHDEQQMVMVSVDGLAKIRNLERDQRVSVVAEGGERGSINGLVLSGQVTFIEGDDRQLWGERFGQKYSPEVQGLWGGPEMPDNRRVFGFAPRVSSAFGL